MRLVDVISLDKPTKAVVTSRYDLSVVVPTLNEAKNIPILYASLQTVLSGLRWELVIVDDNSRDESDSFAGLVAADSQLPASKE